MADLPGIPKDFSLTGYMDPAFKYFAEQTKLPIDEISPIIGGELYGAGTELVCDMLMKGLLSKAVQTCIGIGTTAYSIWGDGLSPRLRRELLEYGTHEVSRIIDPKPSDLIGFNLMYLRSGVRTWYVGVIMLCTAPLISDDDDETYEAIES